MDILMAFGGNAILRENDKGTFEEQYSNVKDTAKRISEIVKMGHRIVITHGNGPQVGDIVSMYEWSKDRLPPMPLPVCGAESQGMIGYMITQALTNELRNAGMKKEVACVLTQTLVDKMDPHFENPSKPIGPFYNKEESDAIAKRYKWTMVKEEDKYRRVVASPIPVGIIELDAIKKLFGDGTIVVCAGGGGVPVAMDNGSLEGMNAVIDKDLVSSLLAIKLKVDLFVILTDVKSVFLDYGGKDQRAIKHMTVDECEKYINEGQFHEGSMKPKVEAAKEFVKATGKKAVITSLENAENAITLEAGTVITK